MPDPLSLGLPSDPPLHLSGNPSWVSVHAHTGGTRTPVLLGHDCLPILAERLQSLLLRLQQGDLPDDPTQWTWVFTLSAPLRAAYLRGVDDAEHLTLRWEEGADGSPGILQSVSAEQLHAWDSALGRALQVGRG